MDWTWSNGLRASLGPFNFSADYHTVDYGNDVKRFSGIKKHELRSFATKGRDRRSCCSALNQRVRFAGVILLESRWCTFQRLTLGRKINHAKVKVSEIHTPELGWWRKLIGLVCKQIRLLFIKPSGKPYICSSIRQNFFQFEVVATWDKSAVPWHSARVLGSLSGKISQTYIRLV